MTPSLAANQIWRDGPAWRVARYGEKRLLRILRVVGPKCLTVRCDAQGTPTGNRCFTMLSRRFAEPKNFLFVKTIERSADATPARSGRPARRCGKTGDGA
jgi:hypothetical protein